MSRQASSRCLASSTRGCCCIYSIFSTREFFGTTTRSSSSSTDTLRSIFLKVMSKRTVHGRACLACRPQHSWPATHPLRQRNSSLKNATTTTTKMPRRYFLVVGWFVSEEACYGTAAVDIIYSLFLLKRLLTEKERVRVRDKVRVASTFSTPPCPEYEVQQKLKLFRNLVIPKRNCFI